MVSICIQIKEMEASLLRLQTRVPDLPIPQILISRLLVFLGRELTAMIDQRLRPHGLNDIEFRVLSRVYAARAAGVFPGELHVSLAQSPANITRLTDRLVEHALITRVPDAQDRRRLVLKTTPEGDRLVEALLPLMLDASHQSYRSFSAENLQQLLDGLNQLARAMDQAGAQASA